MIQYLLLATVLSSFLSFGYTADIAGEILSGQIINYLLKPFNFITFAFLKELAQKTINLCFVCVEVSIFVFIIQTFPTFHITALRFFEFLIFFILSILLSFNISFLISLSGFWSPEVWGPRFVYTVFMSIVAGTLFPLDILPPLVYKLLLFTPLPYLFFIPAKILVKDVPELFFAFAMSIIWTVLSFMALRLLWKKGLREYGFYGR